MGVQFNAFTRNNVNASTAYPGWYNSGPWPTPNNGSYVGFTLHPASAPSSYFLTSLVIDVQTKNMLENSGNWEIWELGAGSAARSGTFANLKTGISTGISLPVNNLAFNSDITIRFFALPSNNGKDTVLAFDNVTLAGTSPVPEPVNVALGVFGVLALGGAVGRRFLANRRTKKG